MINILHYFVDFDDLTNNHSVQPGVQGLTISTDETTKVIKVLSVNGSSRSQTVHHISSLPSKQKVESYFN